MLLPIVLLILSYGKYSNSNVKESSTTEVEKYVKDIIDQDGSMLLSSYLDFTCDGFYIVGPYATSEYKHELLGQKWYNYPSYASYLFNETLFHGDTTDEILQQLVFVKDGKIVSVATTQRKDGDFVFLKDKSYNIDKLFINIENDNGENKVIEEM